jgi:hypothetical protein
MAIQQLKGFINNDYKVIYDSGELSSAQTSITISSLDGNTDEEYVLICRFINGYAGTTQFNLRLNNDSNVNYGLQVVKGNNATASAARSVGINIMKFSYNDLNTQNNILFSKTLIHAKSGYVRTLLTESASDISGTTVTQVETLGQVWNNTADNLTSIVIEVNQTNGIGIGSRIILLKKANIIGIGSGIKNIIAGTRKGSWERIYSTTLTSAATSVTISSLNGNSDVLYRLRIRPIAGADSTRFSMLVNSDTGFDYGYQFIRGTNTDISAVRWPGDNNWYLRYSNYTTAYAGLIDVLIHAKSGYVRTMICKTVDAITGTTITTASLWGQSWNNTADNITSLTIFSDKTNGLGIGTIIELERLNL